MEEQGVEPAAVRNATREILRTAGIADADRHARNASEYIRRAAEDPTLAGAPTEIRRAAELGSTPELVGRLDDFLGEEVTGDLLRACWRPGGLSIRINPAMISREQALAALAKAGLPAEPVPFAPHGIRLLRKVDLREVSGLPPGSYEVQDVGSQMIGLALGAGDADVILDACAGGGGKALQLACESPGRKVVAHDIDAARLAPLAERAWMAGAANIDVIEPGTVTHDIATYDAVLIDAPCLGLGRLRREPLIPWQGRLEPRLQATAQLQRECLEQYATLVRPGGIVVYAVCSLDRMETTDLVDGFLRDHADFEPAELPVAFLEAPLGAMLHREASQVFLLPSLHDTDGFFIARMRRREASSGR